MNSRNKYFLFAASIVLILLLYFVLGLKEKSSTQISNDNIKTNIITEEGNKEIQSFAKEKLNGEVKNASLSRVLKLHKEWSKFPPNSRPIDDGAVDLIHPNFIEEPLNNAVFRDESGNIHQANFKCRFQPKKHLLTHRDKTLSLIFYCLDSLGEIYDVDVTAITGTGKNPNESWTIDQKNISFERGMVENYELSEVSGWKIEYKKTSGQWGDIRLTINYLDESEERNFSLSKSFLITDRSVGEFTNIFKEKIKNGSLIIEAEVEIYEAGWYQFDANLKNDEGYIAASSYEKKLKKGKHTVPFLFFGRLFHIKSADGPYLMTGTRGARISSPVDDALTLPPDQFRHAVDNAVYDNPPVEPIPSAKVYQTEYYDFERFSSREYQSIENTKYQENISDLIIESN